MSAEIQPAVSLPLPQDPDDATTTPAIERCCQAYDRAAMSAIAEGHTSSHARKDADYAFMQAMPPLCGGKNIRDFVACVGIGMLFNIFPNSTATGLLYAAQVAHNALPKHPRRAGRDAA